MSHAVILLAGPSGSGKSRLARRLGAATMRLDDFYRDGDDPDLPWLDGRVDWDDVRSWHPDRAAQALDELVRTGSAEVPRYSIAENRAVGTHRVAAPAHRLLIAEGIFAPDLMESCRRRGMNVRGIYLDRPRLLVFLLRLRRDLAQHRKPAAVLIRRGWWLLGQDRLLRRRCLALGFEPMSMRRAERDLGEHPRPSDQQPER